MNYQSSIPMSGDQPEVLKDKLTPKAIVAALNEHIVGQDDAKKAVAVALRNRWRRQQLSPERSDAAELPPALRRRQSQRRRSGDRGRRSARASFRDPRNGRAGVRS